MKKLYLFTLAMLISSVLFAQKFSWVKSCRASVTGFTSESKDVAVDAQGNIYMVGTFSGTVDFDPGPGVANLTATGPKTNSDDIFILKLNVAGAFQWVKRIGSIDYDIAEAVHISKDGYLYITGYFRQTVDFDPGPGVTNLVGTTSAEVFVAKYDSDGNLVWAKPFVSSGTGMGEGGHDITGDEAGNLYVTGAFGGTIDFDPGPGTANITGTDDAFLLKLNANGEYKWAQKRGGSSTWDEGAALTYFKGNVYWGVERGIPSEVVKLDTLGNVIWFKLTQQVGTNTDGQPTIQAMTTDPSGNLIIVGDVSKAVDFDPGPGVAAVTALNGTWPWDAFVWKMDDDGNFKWVKRIGSTGAEHVYAVEADDNGSVFIAATYGADISMVIDGVTLNLPCLGSTNSFVAEFNAAGYFQNAAHFSGVNSSAGFSVRGMAMNQYRDIYFTGIYWGTVDFDPGSGTYLQSSALSGIGDIYVCKLARGNIITGKVYIDANLDNTYQPTEQKAPYVIVRAASGSDTSYGLSGKDGNYAIGTGQGSYVLSVPDPKVYSTASTTQTINFSSSTGAIDSNHHMPVVYLPGMQDMYVSITSLTIPRANRDYLLDVIIENRGSAPVSGTVTLHHSSWLNFIGSPSPIVYSGNQVQFSYTDLYPSETRRQMLVFHVPIVPVGTLIKDTAAILPVLNDITPHNNYYFLTDTVRASLDPNDKQVLPRGDISPAYAASDSAYLDYTVRFQNTGNDTAFNIMVLDTLSSNLDIASLEMIASSHDYVAEIDGRTLRFKFSDILLPDSITNEPLSHGYIRYRIKVLPSLSVGAQVRNKAAIYFDYNDPVITNETITTVAIPVLPVTWGAFEVQNEQCRQNVLRWSTLTESNNAIFNIQRKSGSGEWQVIGSVKATGNSNVVTHYSYSDKKLLAGTAYYRLQQVDNDGRSTYSPVRSTSCDKMSQVMLYPNPVKDELYISAVADFSYVITDVQGKILVQDNSLASFKNISLRAFSKGTYFVKVITATGSTVHPIVKE